jgi:hypothetical protein
MANDAVGAAVVLLFLADLAVSRKVTVISRITLIRTICCAYWCLLTFLLLHPNPLGLLGIERLPGPSGGFGVHFVCFSGLGFLIAASRFPVRRAVGAACMVSYAVVAEAAQRLVPNRVVDPIDAAENLAGLVVGAAIWWIAWNKLRPLTLAAMASREHPNQKSED